MTNLISLQLAITEGSVTSNIETVALHIELAKTKAQDIVCLPELITTGYDWYAIDNATESDFQVILSKLSRLAAQHRIWLISGSIVEVEGNEKYNTSFLFAPDGSIVGKYRKIHLFSVIAEDKHFSSGNEITVFDCGGVKVGIAICYDLRFPEVFRKLALKGALAVFVPSEWPSIRQQMWSLLLRARAIENQYYVIGCNRGGRDAKNMAYGNSLISDANGQFLAEIIGESNGVIKAIFNSETVLQTRKHIPSLCERRPDIYMLDSEVILDSLANEYHE